MNWAYIGDKIDLGRMRRERVEKAREQMEKHGIGAYLCFEPSNIMYLTDTYSVSVERLLARNVLFPRTGDPILYEWGYRYERFRDELHWLKGNVRPGWRLRFYLLRGVEPVEFLNDLKKVLAEHGVSNQPLAVDTPILTVDFTDILRRTGLTVTDAMPSLMQARMIKTKDEIECCRIGVSICDGIFDRIRETIRPGIRERDLVALINQIAISEGGNGPTECLVNFGENTSPNMFGSNSDRRLRPHELIYIDLTGVRYRGYNTCYYRTFSCGRATMQQKELYSKCLEIQKDGLKAVKSGNTTADICKAWPSPAYWGAKTWQEVSDNAIGHGLGLDNQEPPGITPLISFEHPITLQENMHLAIETWYGIPYHDRPISTFAEPREGTRVEDQVIVTKDGCEILTPWPKDEITECWV